MTERNFDQLATSAKWIDFSGSDSAPALGRLAHTEGFSELGRFLVTEHAKDIGAFKTPTLRDCELTTPYMHNGSFKTLLDVVRFYNRGGERNTNLDERMRPLNLTEEEMSCLVEFLRALTSDDVLRRAQQTAPQNRSPVPIAPISSLKFTPPGQAKRSGSSHPQVFRTEIGKPDLRVH